jgi:hypothetical protein
LHDHNQCARLFGIEPVGKNLSGEPQHLVALDIALDVLQIMRVVIPKNVGTKSGDAMHGPGQSLAAPVVVVVGLQVLHQMKTITPQVLVPGRFDQLAALDAVVGGQLGIIAQIRKPHTRSHPGFFADGALWMLARRIRVLRPHPRWKEYVKPQRFYNAVGER